MDVDTRLIAQVIGRPWKQGASGPHSFDCRGLVVYTQSNWFKRRMPSIVLEADRKDWSTVREDVTKYGWHRTIEKPQVGDVLVVRGAAGAHLGVFVKYGIFGVLHCQGDVRRAGTVRFDRLEDLLSSGYSRPEIWRFYESRS